ncbi:helix-turn-helix transcriptional regulator [Gemmobacter nectariphilus]|uniref:helix-turn-helix transcriptional regulator n=1 Tax=Gemmobacter nectariphilus TaxID=220343 RepID=UPI0003FBE5BB|nr:helix-turn-helix transcriptional regulator [Gemmobacter nectariphilus]
MSRIEPVRRLMTGVSLRLAFAFCVQGIAAVYFLIESAAEMAEHPGGLHTLIEAPLALALTVGMGIVGQELIRSMRIARQQQSALADLTTDFRAVVETRLARWNLTAAERDLAFLSLRGAGLEEIAVHRGVAPGTVRAQFTRIYAKAGVSNRSQLAAVFVAELLGDETATTGTPQARSGT